MVNQKRLFVYGLSNFFFISASSQPIASSANKKSKLKDKLKLVILGDGKGKFYRNIDNVKYYGKVDFEFVITIVKFLPTVH